MKRRTIMLLGLSAFCATPAAAQSNVFWTFGFYFPDRIQHRAGGFGSSDGDARVPAAPIEVASLTPLPDVALQGMLNKASLDSSYRVPPRDAAP